MEKNDILVLKELGKKTAEIAELPIQQERKRQWIALNSLKPERPMFTIDQVPWHEMDVNEELVLRCKDEFTRQIETFLRRQLYKWNHMQDDLVVEKHINIPMAIEGITYGLDVIEDLAKTDDSNDVVSHHYKDQLKTYEDLEKIRYPDIKLNEAETKRREEIAHEAFDGILEVRMDGYTPSFNIWDKIVQWRGVDSVLYDLIDRPEFMHKLMERVTDVSLNILKQLEEKGLLGQPQATIHCSGAWTDELPQEKFNPHPMAKDLWTYGMAQIFATVSPDMHDEFEIEYAKHWYEKFGLGYYGCCEPLDKKMHIVRKLPNIRKVAMSPWADIECGAEAIGRDYVLSCKPTPAHLAGTWQPEEAKKDVEVILKACQKYNCACEFLLKDISTVKYRPQSLWEWADIVRAAIN
jgi:hypothetical protein